jgi:gliding motility-associated-like protein
MKKQFLYSVILLVLGFGQLIQAQTKELKKHDPEAFDEEAALAQAKAKGIKSSELKGYVQYLKNDFSSQNALKKQGHIHTPYEGGVTGDVPETVIYLEPNKPMSIGCPNMGFEQYNFTNWTGGKGTVATGPVGGNPIYTSTGSTILNSAGNNVSIANTVNYHTIMTIPATNSVVPNQVSGGYDSLACKVSGTQTVSEIPVVSPFSFDPISVRMNSSNAGLRACRLKYITTTSSTNQQLTYSFALVLNDPASHAIEESPYFKVEIRNETTNTLLPGCASFAVNPKTALATDSLKTSVFQMNSAVVKYRKWQYYTVDLSMLPSGTSVSVNFEVGDCALGIGGHAGYAYVDADCGGIGKPYANMCSGSSFATLVAPQGFVSYQWQTMPGNLAIAGATNDTLVVPGANVGDVYAVQMITAGGCTLTLTDTVKLTTVSIINLNANSSCAGGASGSAYVQANGSNGIYTYTWTNVGTGLVVGNSQTATGLSSGNYSVVVASTTCGQASANISVGISPPFFISQNKTFCGNSTYIAKSGGSNYQWYQGSPSVLISAPNGTNDTLQIATAVAGNIYTLVYTNASGCKDSIRYTLNQIAGGNSYVNNIKNVCPTNADGSAVINLSTTFPSPFSYYVTGPTAGIVVSNTLTSSSTLTVSPLALGTYSYLIDDGVCLYNSTFTISNIQTNFTITPTNSVICYPSDTAKIKFNFEAAPTSCGLDPAICSGSYTQLFNSGPFLSNIYSNYPSPFSGWWYSAKQQFLVKATELNAVGIFAGKISSIAFNVTALNGSPLTYPDYQIKMGCTSLTNLSTGGAQTFISGLLTVYNNPNQPVNLGWVTHNFSQSYIWDGISNIIIEVCSGGLSTSAGENASIELKQMPYVANMKSVNNSTPSVSSCGDLSSNTSGVYMTNGINMLPNMRFGYCSNVVPASAYTVAVSNGSITANYNNDSIKIVPPATFTVPATNTPYIYTISVTNPNGGCVKTQTVAILYPGSTTSITAIPTNTSICEGSQLNLSVTGAVTYTWSYGSISNTIAATQSVVVTPPITGLNTYIVTGSAPCGALPDTKTITVNVIPKADLLISPLQDVTKCLNKNYVITTGVGSTTPGNAGTPYAYAWTTLPANAPATGVNTSSNYTVTSNTTTTLVVTVNGNCANATKDTIVIKNFVNNLAVSIVDSSTTCAGTEFTLHSNVTGGYPGYNYGWFIDSNTSPLSTSANLTSISPANQGTYLIIVNVNDSCGYAKSASEVITVLPPCNVIIPNVITPNGDGVNDYFRIANIEHHPNTTVTLFDRWGRKVYENANYNNDWKADHLSDGTYFYVVEVPDDKKYSGFITVFHNK